MTCRTIPRGGLDEFLGLSPGAVVCDDGISPAEGFGVAEDYGIDNYWFDNVLNVTNAQRELDRFFKQSNTWYGKSVLGLTNLVHGVASGLVCTASATLDGIFSIPAIAVGVFTGKIGFEELVEGFKTAVVTAGDNVVEGAMLAIGGRVSEGFAKMTDGAVNAVLMIQGGVPIVRSAGRFIAGSLKGGGGALLALPEGQVLATVGVAASGEATAVAAATQPWQNIVATAVAMSMGAESESSGKSGTPTQPERVRENRISEQELADVLRECHGNRKLAARTLAIRSPEKAITSSRIGQLIRKAVDGPLVPYKDVKIGRVHPHPQVPVEEIAAALEEHGGNRARAAKMLSEKGYKIEPTRISYLIFHGENGALAKFRGMNGNGPLRPRTHGKEILAAMTRLGGDVDKVAAEFGVGPRTIYKHTEGTVWRQRRKKFEPKQPAKKHVEEPTGKAPRIPDDEFEMTYYATGKNVAQTAQELGMSEKEVLRRITRIRGKK